MGKLYKRYLESWALNDKNNDGFFDAVSDIYFSKEVQSLKKYEQHLDIDRLQHITGVSFLSYKICKRLGLRHVQAARAAVMHDLFYYDWRDGKTGKWHKLHGYKHPYYALLNACELYPQISELEKGIIRRHMWPLTVVPPTSPEGLVVSLCDKYCATREVIYSLSPKRKAAFEKEIERVKNDD